jgi:hypothetical protein
LGGHVDGCDDCGYLRVAYNSCLMGKICNGESAIDPASDMTVFRIVRRRFSYALLPISVIGFRRRRPLSVLSSGL